MNNFNKEQEIAVGIAREAGAIMLKYFDGDQEIEIKKDDSQVTIADKMINSLVIERLSKAFPDDGVIGEEESTSEYGSGRKWFCDPIDGTAAYVWGTPTAMFSLGLVVDGKPVMGVAYDPFLDRMYTGQKGKESYCNGEILSASSVDLKSGIMAITGGIKDFSKTKFFQKMIDEKIRVACFSGCVYKCCLLAKGKFAGFIEAGANAHDIAASHVILEGAGAKITSLTGGELDYSKPLKGAIVSNRVTHDELMKYYQ